MREFRYSNELEHDANECVTPFFHVLSIGRKMILGVERLDYTKGILQRLQCFRDLLATDPNLVDKVMFIQVIVPSRIDAPECKCNCLILPHGSGLFVRHNTDC